MRHDETDLRDQWPEPQPAGQARAGNLRHDDARRDRGDVPRGGRRARRSASISRTSKARSSTGFTRRSTRAPASSSTRRASRFTSIAILDALKMFSGPIIELHISNIHRREAHYHHSLVSKVATAVIAGLGPRGYAVAVRAIARSACGGFEGGRAVKTSIATVSISGDLREKLAAIAAAGFDGVEIFENDFLAFDGSPAEVGRMVQRSRAGDHAVPAVPRFRGHAGAAALARLRPGRAQVRSDAGAGHRPHARLLQRLAGRTRRDRPGRRRFPARLASWRPNVACASATRRSPGAGTSATIATPGRSSGAPNHPNIGLILDSFHTLARRVDVGDDPRHPRRSHLHRSARRRAAHRHGPAVLEPPLPQHAGRGRSAGSRFHARGRGDRL